MPPFLTQHYNVRIKDNWGKSEKGVASTLHPGVVAIEKWPFSLLSTTVSQVLSIYLSIYPKET